VRQVMPEPIAHAAQRLRLGHRVGAGDREDHAGENARLVEEDAERSAA
jgi:hypothetical protein